MCKWACKQFSVSSSNEKVWIWGKCLWHKSPYLLTIIKDPSLRGLRGNQGPTEIWFFTAPSSKNVCRSLGLTQRRHLPDPLKFCPLGPTGPTVSSEGSKSGKKHPLPIDLSTENKKTKRSAYEKERRPGRSFNRKWKDKMNKQMTTWYQNTH
jgi:hypothetical protein